MSNPTASDGETGRTPDFDRRLTGNGDGTATRGDGTVVAPRLVTDRDPGLRPGIPAGYPLREDATYRNSINWISFLRMLIERNMSGRTSARGFKVPPGFSLAV